MIIRIFEPLLQCQVVHVGHGQFGLDFLYAHGFELQVGHCTHGILGQGLVDFDTDFASGRHLAGNQMCGEALHFGKAMLLMPEEALEQRLNGEAVRSCGAGDFIWKQKVTAEMLKNFLADEKTFSANAARSASNGLAEALDAIENCLSELVK